MPAPCLAIPAPVEGNRLCPLLDELYSAVLTSMTLGLRSFCSRSLYRSSWCFPYRSALFLSSTEHNLPFIGYSIALGGLILFKTSGGK